MGVLVTGGAGYIGSVVTERLLAAGEAVVVYDNFSTGYRDALAPGAVPVEGDIQNGATLARVFADHPIDTVMHFAAFISVGESCAEPRKYFRNNTVGALTVLDAMADAGIPHFILSSTAAVYGDPDAVPITEEMPTRPKNPYGLSKRFVERILEWYGHAYGMRSVALRYFNASGASETFGESHRPESHLIPNILRAADGALEQVVVFGRDYATPDGTCVRDYIHVVDLADAHMAAMRYLRAGGTTDVFNLGNAVGHSVLEVIASVERVMGRKVPVVYGARRPGDADRLVASSEKACRVLGWAPSRGDIDTIVRDAWTWHQAHPKGYAR